MPVCDNRWHGHLGFNSNSSETSHKLSKEPDRGTFVKAQKVAGLLKFSQKLMTEIELFPLTAWFFIWMVTFSHYLRLGRLVIIKLLTLVDDTIKVTGNGFPVHLSDWYPDFSAGLGTISPTYWGCWTLTISAAAVVPAALFLTKLLMTGSFCLVQTRKVTVRLRICFSSWICPSGDSRTSPNSCSMSRIRPLSLPWGPTLSCLKCFAVDSICYPQRRASLPDSRPISLLLP